ncbi:MAG TPA: hypothetical protein DIC42_05340 [Holosporales bacterium]|nr:hypothetical protein [Holosporales bacterium]
MKTINEYVLSAIIIAFLTVNTSAFAQVGIGTTNPDPSSMLDIQSNAKGVLIPRMLTSERIAITSPANGLLVFDTDTKSFWFRDGSAWKELVSGGELVDTDGDTRVEVEKTADEDKIRFTTLGTEKMYIDKDGNTRIGNGTDNTYIEADGSLSYEGSATRYDDLKVPVSSTTKGGSKAPEMSKLKDDGSLSQGVFIEWFDAAQEEELYFTVQMPHQWKEGTEIYPHLHWTAATNVGTDKVVWGLEYSWTNVGSLFGNTTTITGGDPIDAVGAVSAYEHAITSLGAIIATGKTLSSMLVCRIFRKAADGADNYAADAGLLEIDFHFQIDSDGSRLEYIK